jgi:hypothetical protein
MAFGGGGGGQITAHVHDNTPLQGGPLNMAGTTIGSLNAGSITYSDGAALQELVIGNTADTLTVSGGNPTWSAAGAGTQVFKETFTQSSDSTYLTCTFADSYIYNNFSSLIAVGEIKYTGGTSGVGLCQQINNSGSWFTADYFSIGTFVNNPAYGNWNEVFQSADPQNTLFSDISNTTGAGINNGGTVSFKLQFFDGKVTSYDRYWKPYSYSSYVGGVTEMQSGYAAHERPDFTDEPELEGIRFFFNSDFTASGQVGDVAQDSYCTFWTVANT